MKKIIPIFLLTIICSVTIYSQKIQSIYTDLKTCKEIKTDHENSILYRGKCRGIGSYQIILYQSEHHQLINLLNPNRKELELGLLEQGLSAAPSSLGEKVEWRISREGKKIKPFALIVRLNIFDNPDNSYQAKSYLLVIKIGQKTACITDVIDPTVKNQNVKARELADISANKPCREN